MRKLFVLAVVAGLLGAGAYSQDAGAVNIVTFELVAGQLPNPNAMLPGETLTFNLRLTTDVGLSAWPFIVEVQGAGSIVGARNQGGDTFEFPSFGIKSNDTTNVADLVCSTTRNCTSASGGIISGTHGGLNLAGAAPFTNADIGDVIVRANGAGAITLILRQRGSDGWVDNVTSAPIIPNLTNTFSLTVIPEPGTVSLVGLGLVGLIVAGRRRARS